MVPAVMVMVHPVVTVLHGDLVAACERIPILIAMPAIGWRTAEHHGATSVQRTTRSPVIVGCIHPVMKSTAVHIVEVRWRNIPPLTILIALLLLTVLVARTLLPVLIARLLLTILIARLWRLTILITRLLRRGAAVLLCVQQARRSCQECQSHSGKCKAKNLFHKYLTDVYAQ